MLSNDCVHLGLVQSDDAFAETVVTTSFLLLLESHHLRQRECGVTDAVRTCQTTTCGGWRSTYQPILSPWLSPSEWVSCRRWWRVQPTSTSHCRARSRRSSTARGHRLRWSPLPCPEFPQQRNTLKCDAPYRLVTVTGYLALSVSSQILEYE